MKFAGGSHSDAFIVHFLILKNMKLISIYLLTSLLSISHAQVSLDEARSLVGNSSVTVLDIREPDEHATGVAKGMKLIPMSTLESREGLHKSAPQPPRALSDDETNKPRHHRI